MSAQSAKPKKTETAITRRQWLAQMTALASATAMPLWVQAARAKSQSSFTGVPGIALVVGINAYAQAPLHHPANDARAIGAELAKLGFQVSVQIDAGRTQLIDAMREFTNAVAANNSVGLFYFAGRGAQLASRNYLIPVDAAIRRPADLRDQAIDLDALMRGLSAAANPVNAVILDACRDNPFSDSRDAQRGLSQYDALPGTLLAYAAQPGTIAPDVNGRNGRYAQNLARELAAPHTAIEDVFKRVRLSVRRQSEGRQIPWESTGLEDDFYLSPSASITAPTRDESARKFATELDTWRKVESSRHSPSLEYYLHRYPSGKFSELAQFRLESLAAKKQPSLMRAAMTSFAGGAIAANPFSKGTFRPDGRFSVGDSYAYQRIDTPANASYGRFTETVTGMSGAEVLFNGGKKITDFLGNDLNSEFYDHASPAQFFPAEYAIGRRWTTRLQTASVHGLPADFIDIKFRIATKETITVPAGTFDTFKIAGEACGAGGNRWKSTLWVAPEISRRPVATELTIANGARTDIAERYELADFKQLISPAADGHRLGVQVAQGLALCSRDGSGRGRTDCRPVA